MKTRTFFFAAALTALMGLLVFSAGALAAKPPGAGGGGVTAIEPPDYGDLFVLYRDADGVPILTIDGCQQPLAAEDLPDCPITWNCRLIPVDPDTCAVELGYETYTQEVDFGRINEVRSADLVFEAQLEDAVIKLATAGCISLDPAGRLVASSLTDGEVVTSTIDSPLQNLAIYRQLMLEGTLGEAVELPADWLITAARALGAASDKGGKISMDLVIYINETMGLTEDLGTGMLGKNCIDVKKEVMGEVQLVHKCFLDYSGFEHNRRLNFGEALPRPAYIPRNGPPADGWFEYLDVLDESEPTFKITQGPILDAVPEFYGDPDLDVWNISAFAQAADDTRAVIEFMHSWPIPGDYATPVSCTVSGDIFYDVSISEYSGLQVPVRMVAGTEGREGTITIANAGPAAATGTVMVTGEDSTGNPVGPLYLVVDGLPTAEIIFAGPEDFIDLPAGSSQSWTFFFSIAAPTTITWSATATADNDVNLSNNSVTAETLVLKSTGGGGRR